MLKRIKFYFVSGLIIVLCLLALYYRYQAERGAGSLRRILDGPAVVQQIQQLQQLVTVQYVLQEPIGLEEEKIPFGSEKIALLVQANVLAGVDLSQLTPRDLTVNGDQSVTVRLPRPKVLHVYIDENKTRVWDRSKTWWTPWAPLDPELEQKARLAALETVRAAALETGILSNAQQNAEASIRALLDTLGVKSLRFEPPAALEATR